MGAEAKRGRWRVVSGRGCGYNAVSRMPGRSPVKLGQGESLVVVPGTVVDIGDGNLIEVLPLQSVGSDAVGAESGDGGRQR